MIVGSLSFCIPTLRFRPADSGLPASNPLPSLALPQFLALSSKRAKPISFPFNPLRTLCKNTRGTCPPRRVIKSASSFDFSTLNSGTSSPLSPSESALVDVLRVLTEISRNCPSASPLESALTRIHSVTPLESALTKKLGGRGLDVEPAPRAAANRARLSCPYRGCRRKAIGAAEATRRCDYALVERKAAAQAGQGQRERRRS